MTKSLGLILPRWLLSGDRLRVDWLSGWEGYRESGRCSRDTYPEPCITKYTSIRRQCKPSRSEIFVFVACVVSFNVCDNVKDFEKQQVFDSGVRMERRGERRRERERGREGGEAGE